MKLFTPKNTFVSENNDNSNNNKSKQTSTGAAAATSTEIPAESNSNSARNISPTKRREETKNEKGQNYDSNMNKNKLFDKVSNFFKL